MNSDFHYYGTYVAARLAGFSFSEAKIIAYSASYVNDSDSSMLNINCLPDLLPIATTQTEEQIKSITNPENWYEENLIKINRIWVPFHFPPGNYGSTPKKVIYGGAEFSSNKNGDYTWFFDEEASEQFKLICLPNSPLISDMINDIILNFRDKENLLHITGLRMHTLADSWSNTYFAGIPSWFINNVASPIINLDYGNKVDFTKNNITATGTPYFNSFNYLGHRSIDSIPDYSFVKYRYKPNWSYSYLDKDNRTDYLKAFIQMVVAMKCIRENKPFSIESKDSIDINALNIISKILSERTNYSEPYWRQNIGKIKINSASLEVPEAYNKGLWLQAALDSINKKTTNYYYFNASAISHLSLVEERLKENSIFIGETPNEKILQTGLITDVGAVGSNFPSSRDYPIIRVTSVKFNLIKSTVTPLKSGDIIRIQSTEDTLESGDYLVNFEDQQGLFYAEKDINISKGKWRILKVSGSPGNTIVQGDVVRFENLHYYKKPFMSYYKDLSIDKYFLTTSATASPETNFTLNFTLNNIFDITNRISAGYYISSAIRKDGFVVTWGDNSYGACNVPLQATNVKAISSYKHVLALLENGKVIAWGDTSNNKCNTAGLENIVAVSATDEASLFLKADGTVIGVGIPGHPALNIPAGLNNVKSIFTSPTNGAAIKSDGTVVVWGDNTYGQCDVPNDLTPIQSLVLDLYFIVAVTIYGIALSWGNTSPQLSILSPISDLTKVSLTSRSIYMLFNNSSAQKADANGVADFRDILDITSSLTHTLFLTSNGTVLADGDCSKGQCAIPQNLTVF